jgi:nucleoside-diphosphate-sugar epimerase
VDVRQGDVTDDASVRAAMAGTDGVFHLAGWYRVGVRDERAAWAINVEGTRSVLRAMGDLAIPRGVYTSTLAVFGDTHGRLVDETYRTAGPWLSVYDHTKWLAHYEVAEPLIQAGLPLIVVQPGGVYGVGDPSAIGQTLRAYLKRRLPAVPGRSAYCWGHVEDTASAHVLAMQRGTPGQSYIVAGPPHSLVEALRVVEQVTGYPRATVSDSTSADARPGGYAGRPGTPPVLADAASGVDRRVPAGRRRNDLSGLE